MQTYARILLLMIVAAACQQAPKADKAAVSEAEAVSLPTGGVTHRLDTMASKLFWIGTKPTGEHKGTFRFSGGELYSKDSSLTGGYFIINVTSIANLDLSSQPDMKKKLEDELRGENFFDAGNYPEARFEITEVSPYRPAPNDEGVLLKDATHMIKGNLTIKNTTKNITFPAKVVFTGGKVKGEANFNIDRTHWGMTYRADKSLQDKLINSVVNIHFEIVTQ